MYIECNIIKMYHCKTKLKCCARIKYYVLWAIPHKTYITVILQPTYYNFMFTNPVCTYVKNDILFSKCYFRIIMFIQESIFVK